MRAKSAARAHAADKVADHGHAAKEVAAEPVESATASHILIRYAGSARAPADITRSKDEAKQLAQSIANKAKAPGADFGALASQYTEDSFGQVQRRKARNVHARSHGSRV